MSKFGETIRQLREAQNLGLREVAELVNIAPTYLSRIERGKELPPTTDIINKMAKVLAADPNVLLSLCAVENDREIVKLLKARPKLKQLLRLLIKSNLGDRQLERIICLIEEDILKDGSVSRSIEDPNGLKRVLTTTGSQ